MGYVIRNCITKKKTVKGKIRFSKLVDIAGEEL
jgi:hypothetical protein